MLDALAEIDARLDYADELDDAGAQSAPAALLRARDILNELEKRGFARMCSGKALWSL